MPRPLELHVNLNITATSESTAQLRRILEVAGRIENLQPEEAKELRDAVTRFIFHNSKTEAN